MSITQHIPTPTTASHRQVYFAIMLASLVDSIAVGILMAAIPILAVQLGGSVLTVAALVSCQFIAGAIGSLTLGWLGDRVARGMLLLATLALLALSYALLPFVTSLFWLFAVRMVAGFMSSNLVLLESFISEITTHENRSVGIAKLRLGSTMGLIVGPGAAGLLSGAHWFQGLQPLLILAAAIAVLQPAIVAYGLRGQLTRKRITPHSAGHAKSGALARFAGTARIRDFALIKMVIATCFAALMAITPVWAIKSLGWGTQELSHLVSVFGLSLLIVQIIIARNALPWLTSDNALFIACLIVVPGFALLIALPGTISIFVCCALLGLSCAVVNIVTPTAISRAAPLEVGTMLGLMSTTVLVGNTLVPMILSTVYETVGDKWAWSGALLCAATAAWLAWRHLVLPKTLNQVPADG